MTDHSQPRGTGKGRKRPFWTNARRETAAGLLFIAPQFTGIVLFVLVPLILVFWYSLHEWNALSGSFRFVGSGNYLQMLRDPLLSGVLWATIVFSLLLVAAKLVMALSLAMLLNQKLAGIGIFRTLFFTPVVVTLVAWTIVWSFLLQKNGGINAFLGMVGITGPNWLREPWAAMASVVIVQLFKNVGLTMILFLAALQNVPRELYEAARVDGVPRLRQFIGITLPMISPTLLMASIVIVVGSLQAFAIIEILTRGGPGRSTTVLVYYFYQQSFKFLQFGYGATISILLLVIVAALTYLQWVLRKRLVFYEN